MRQTWAPRMGRLFVAAALLAAALGGLSARPARAKEAPAADAADAETRARWIRDLDDDRFAVREAAHQRLLAAAGQAVDEVGRAAAGPSLESASRAVSILLEWSRSADNALSLAALERLATLKNRPAESAMAAEKLADVRERAAMEALVELGARVEFDQPVLGFAGPTPTLKVVIGPTWTGGVEGLSHIGAVRRATTASFYSASIKGDEAAPRLETITHLQTIEFYGTKVSDAAVERLRGALPHANVDVRGPARLGIAGSPLAGGGGAAVNEVQAGTAAEKAGIVPGDVITEIEGTPVTDFKMLTREIAKAKAGDTITLKVLRQPPVAGQPALPIDVKVQFARWGDEQAVNPTAPSPMGGRPLGAPTRVYMERR